MLSATEPQDQNLAQSDDLISEAKSAWADIGPKHRQLVRNLLSDMADDQECHEFFDTEDLARLVIGLCMGGIHALDTAKATEESDD